MQDLLDKYFAGETSLAEEAELRAYFNGEAIAREHLHLKPMFQYFGQAKEDNLENDFDNKIMKVVRETGDSNKLKMRVLRQRIFKLAAMFLLLIASWFVVQNTLLKRPKTIDEKWAEHEIKDPEKAFETTKAALLFASSKFNRGTKKAAGGVVKIQKVSKYFKTKD